MLNISGRIRENLKNGLYDEVAETAVGAWHGARVMASLAPVLRHDREDIERVFSERMLVEEGRLDRLGSLILVIAAVAPARTLGDGHRHDLHL